MAKRHISAPAAITSVRKRKYILPDSIISVFILVLDRPQVHPNYGFLKQLQAFAECGYAPSPTNPAYIAWKHRRKRDVTRFLNKLVDTVAIIPDKLFLNECVPSVLSLLSFVFSISGFPCRMFMNCYRVAMRA